MFTQVNVSCHERRYSILTKVKSAFSKKMAHDLMAKMNQNHPKYLKIVYMSLFSMAGIHSSKNRNISHRLAQEIGT